MSIQIENNLKDSDNKEIFEQRVHFLPCKVEEDGPANVQKYFEPYVQDNENGELTATFRGRLLNGTKMHLPEGYEAVIVTEAKRPLAENADRRFQVAGGFKELTYWNWDKIPSKNDNLVKALDWVDIAEAISSCNLWPKGIVHYSISPKDYDPHSQELIIDTLRKIQNEVCLKFFAIPVNYTAESGHRILYIQNPTKEKFCPPRNYDFSKSVIDMPIGYKCLKEKEIVRIVVEMLKASIHNSKTVINSYDLMKKFQEKDNVEQISVLGANDRNYINAHYFQECGGLVQRSVPYRRQADDSELEYTQANRKYYNSRVWPLGIVVYKISPKLISSPDFDTVLKAMRKIEQLDTCVVFQEAPKGGPLKPKNMISFEKDGADWPALGFQEGVQVLKLSSIARCEDPGHVDHSLMMMMRILGIPMMSNRYDRDNYVKINWNNVQKGQELFLEKTPEAAWLKHIPYDFNSASHAPANFLCPGCLTTYTVEPIHDHLWHRTLGMGRRRQLSKDDARVIATVYAEQCTARVMPISDPTYHGDTGVNKEREEANEEVDSDAVIIQPAASEGSKSDEVANKKQAANEGSKSVEVINNEGAKETVGSNSDEVVNKERADDDAGSNIDEVVNKESAAADDDDNNDDEVINEEPAANEGNKSEAVANDGGNKKGRLTILHGEEYMDYHAGDGRSDWTDNNSF